MLKNFYKSLAPLLEKLFSFPFYFFAVFFWIFVFFVFLFYFAFFFNSDYFFFFNCLLNELDLLSFSDLHIDSFISQLYLYKFNYYSYYSSAIEPAKTISFFPTFGRPFLLIYQHVLVSHYNSIFIFPFFEDGIVVTYDLKSEGFFYEFLIADYGLNKEGFFYNFLVTLNKYTGQEVKLSPLFANYFFLDFFYSNIVYSGVFNDFFNDFFYFCDGLSENQFFWSLNYLHFYHFDYSSNIDYDLVVKFIYKSFPGDLDDFFNYAFSKDVSKKLIVDFGDIRNSFFWSCHYKFFFQVGLVDCWWYYLNFFFYGLFLKLFNFVGLFSLFPETLFPFVWSEFFIYVFMVLLLLFFYLFFFFFNFKRFFFSFFRIFFVVINYFFYIIYYLFFGYFKLEDYEEGESSFFTRPEPYNNSFILKKKVFMLFMVI